MVLGAQAGALLAEGALLVPMWRRMQPEAFLAWYREHAALLLGFFGPLEVVAGLLAIVAALLAWVAGAPAALLAGATVFALAVLAAFPLYFQRANASFAEATIAPERVPEELARWARWHALRVVLAMAAFALAVLAVSSVGRG